MKLYGSVEEENDSFGCLLTVDYSQETVCVCVCVYIYIYIYIHTYILQVENDGAMRGICYISVPSQLIALVPATSPRLHKEILYANDSLSC